VDLATEYADVPVALAVYLASCYLECFANQSGVPSGDLHLRFLGWIPIRQPAQAPDPALDAYRQWDDAVDPHERAALDALANQDDQSWANVADDPVVIESSNDIALRDAEW